MGQPAIGSSATLPGEKQLASSCPAARAGTGVGVSAAAAASAGLRVAAPAKAMPITGLSAAADHGGGCREYK